MYYFEKGYRDIFDNDDLAFLFEATSNLASHYIIEDLYPKIEAVLSTPQGDRKFKQLVGNYMDRNNEKLHTSGPVYLIPFGDRDKAEYYQLFHITEHDIKLVIDKVVKQIQSTSDFKLLRNNPIFWVFYCCIRFYTLKKDTKGLNTALAIYALSVYPSVFSVFFKHGANEAVMQYTMDNLTDKYIMKQQGHVFGGLFTSIQHSYDFLKGTIKDADDANIIRFIQRIRNDQKSMIKKICDQYMQNHAKGLKVTLTKDSYDEVPIDVDSVNKTSIVESVGNKISLLILTNGVELKYASMVAKITGVSISDCRFYLSKIVTDKNSDSIKRFVESVIFLYLYDENKSREDINSSYFLKWSEELFRKTNSNNDNIRTIKTTLDKWAEDSGVHAKFKREASRVNYKKAIFFYFIFIIQAYNN